MPIRTNTYRLVDAQAVVFDAVGTLLYPDPPAAEVYAATGARFGSRLTAAEIAERFRAAFAREEEFDRAQGFRTSEAREQDRWRRIVAAVLDDVTDGGACFAALFAHFARPDAWRVEPETADVLGELAGRGYMLGLASNYDRRLRSVTGGRPELAPLRHLVISSEVGWRKPATGFFEAVIRAVGFPAQQVLYVGDDRASDYDGARAAGMSAVLFDPRGRHVGTGVTRIARLHELLVRERPAGRP